MVAKVGYYERTNNRETMNRRNVAKDERRCKGEVEEVNVCLERCNFNRRMQRKGETFDAYLSDLRTLIRSCEYGQQRDSILCDRIVFGIRDDATRRRLLNTRKLTLNYAVEICKTNEVAAKQLRVMTMMTLEEMMMTLDEATTIITP